MRNRAGVSISTENGWTVISDSEHRTLWSFTPASRPAHPAAVRRTIVQRGNDIFVDMAVLCEAAKPACDQLVTDFTTLNERIRKELKQPR
jgi:hypothetical protein